MRQGDRRLGVAAEGGLGVLPGGAAGRRVAAVPDGEVPAQRRQRPLVEDLGDQPHVLVDEDRAAVGGGDACRLLPAVLQGVEAVVGELGDLLAGSPDAEDPAGVLRALLAGKQIMREPSVAACHVPQSPTPTPRRSRPSGVQRAPVQQHREHGGEQPEHERADHPEEQDGTGHAVVVAVGRAVVAAVGDGRADDEPEDDAGRDEGDEVRVAAGRVARAHATCVTNT